MLASVREYFSTDIEALTGLMGDLGYPSSIDQMKQRMEAIQSNTDYFTFVACVEDQVVGMIGVRLVHYYEADGVAAQISALVARHDYQGKGIGKQLIAYVEKWALEQGCSSLYLTSGLKPERMQAHEFYKKLGFQITGYRFVKPLSGSLNSAK